MDFAELMEEKKNSSYVDYGQFSSKLSEYLTSVFKTMLDYHKAILKTIKDEISRIEENLILLNKEIKEIKEKLNELNKDLSKKNLKQIQEKILLQKEVEIKALLKEIKNLNSSKTLLKELGPRKTSKLLISF